MLAGKGKLLGADRLDRIDGGYGGHSSALDSPAESYHSDRSAGTGYNTGMSSARGTPRSASPTGGHAGPGGGGHHLSHPCFIGHIATQRVAHGRLAAAGYAGHGITTVIEFDGNRSANTF